MPPAVPREVWECIIDHLYETSSLSILNYALVSRTWFVRCRHHFSNAPSFLKANQLQRLSKHLHATPASPFGLLLNKEVKEVVLAERSRKGKVQMLFHLFAILFSRHFPQLQVITDGNWSPSPNPSTFPFVPPLLMCLSHFRHVTQLMFVKYHFHHVVEVRRIVAAFPALEQASLESITWGSPPDSELTDAMVPLPRGMSQHLNLVTVNCCQSLLLAFLFWIVPANNLVPCETDTTLDDFTPPHRIPALTQVDVVTLAKLTEQIYRGQNSSTLTMSYYWLLPVNFQPHWTLKLFASVDSSHTRVNLKLNDPTFRVSPRAYRVLSGRNKGKVIAVGQVTGVDINTSGLFTMPRVDWRSIYTLTNAFVPPFKPFIQLTFDNSLNAAQLFPLHRSLVTCLAQFNNLGILRISNYHFPYLSDLRRIVATIPSLGTLILRDILFAWNVFSFKPLPRAMAWDLCRIEVEKCSAVLLLCFWVSPSVASPPMVTASQRYAPPLKVADILAMATIIEVLVPDPFDGEIHWRRGLDFEYFADRRFWTLKLNTQTHDSAPWELAALFNFQGVESNSSCNISAASGRHVDGGITTKVTHITLVIVDTITVTTTDWTTLDICIAALNMGKGPAAVFVNLCQTMGKLPLSQLRRFCGLVEQGLEWTRQNVHLEFQLLPEGHSRFIEIDIHPNHSGPIVDDAVPDVLDNIVGAQRMYPFHLLQLMSMNPLQLWFIRELHMSNYHFLHFSELRCIVAAIRSLETLALRNITLEEDGLELSFQSLPCAMAWNLCRISMENCSPLFLLCFWISPPDATISPALPTKNQQYAPPIEMGDVKIMVDIINAFRPGPFVGENPWKHELLSIHYPEPQLWNLCHYAQSLDATPESTASSWNDPVVCFEIREVETNTSYGFYSKQHVGEGIATRVSGFDFTITDATTAIQTNWAFLDSCVAALISTAGDPETASVSIDFCGDMGKLSLSQLRRYCWLIEQELEWTSQNVDLEFFLVPGGDDKIKLIDVHPDHSDQIADGVIPPFDNSSGPLRVFPFHQSLLLNLGQLWYLRELHITNYHFLHLTELRRIVGAFPSLESLTLWKISYKENKFSFRPLHNSMPWALRSIVTEECPLLSPLFFWIAPTAPRPLSDVQRVAPPLEARDAVVMARIVSLSWSLGFCDLETSSNSDPSKSETFVKYNFDIERWYLYNEIARLDARHSTSWARTVTFEVTQAKSTGSAEVSEFCLSIENLASVTQTSGWRAMDACIATLHLQNPGLSRVSVLFRGPAALSPVPRLRSLCRQITQALEWTSAHLALSFYVKTLAGLEDIRGNFQRESGIHDDSASNRSFPSQ